MKMSNRVSIRRIENRGVLQKINEIIWNFKYDILFTIVIIALLLYRISIHADIYDEIINLNVAYRISQGDLPFYQCWEAFQNGDLFLSPFLWLYVKVIGSTGGIVLFSRFVYFVILCGLGLIMYVTTSPLIGKRNAYYIGLLCPLFQLYGLYYLWYDTSSTILLTAGLFIMYYAITYQKGKIKYLCLFLSGMCHALMAFSYPSLLFAAILQWCMLLYYEFRNTNRKTAIYSLVYYTLGAAFILLLFLLYILFIIQVDHFITGLNIILSYRGISAGEGSGIISSIVLSYINVNQFLIVPSLIAIYLFIKSIKNKKFIPFFLLVILISPFINQYMLKEQFQGLANYTGYLALWAPFLYYLLDVKYKTTKISNLLLLVWLTCMFSSFCITLTTVQGNVGPIKCWQSFFPAFIVSLIMINFLLCERKRNYFSKQYFLPLIKIISFIMLFHFYHYIYLKQPYIRMSDSRMGSGIYKGIKVNSEMANYEQVQQLFKRYITPEMETVLASGNLRAIYLMTDLRAFSPSVETPDYLLDGKVEWDMSIKYFELFKDLPDIMVLQSTDLQNEEIVKIIQDHYTMTYDGFISSIEIKIYTKHN